MVGFAKADRFLFHTSAAGFGRQLPHHAGQDHKSKQSARCSAKTKVVMERKESSVRTCACVGVHGTGTVCVRTSVFISMFDAEFSDDLADLAACGRRAFPL